jgi:hypothetical protein
MRRPCSYLQILPVGQISQIVSSPFAENFPLLIRGKSLSCLCHPVPQEGRLAIVTKRGTGCGGRRLSAQTKRTDADGEVVWS